METVAASSFVSRRNSHVNHHYGLGVTSGSDTTKALQMKIELMKQGMTYIGLRLVHKNDHRFHIKTTAKVTNKQASRKMFRRDTVCGIGMYIIFVGAKLVDLVMYLEVCHQQWLLMGIE